MAKLKILVVEDFAATAEYAEHALAVEGFDPRVVRTIAEAEIALRADDYACVVADLGLPNGRGLDVVRAIRAVNPSVPIVVWTVDPSDNMALVAIEQFHVDDVVVKGRRNSISRAVRLVLKKREIAMPDKDDPNLTVGPLNRVDKDKISGFQKAAQAARETLTEKLVEGGVHPAEAVQRVDAKLKETVHWLRWTLLWIGVGSGVLLIEFGVLIHLTLKVGSFPVPLAIIFAFPPLPFFGIALFCASQYNGEAVTTFLNNLKVIRALRGKE